MSEKDAALHVVSCGNKNQCKVMHSNKEVLSSNLVADQLCVLQEA